MSLYQLVKIDGSAVRKFTLVSASFLGHSQDEGVLPHIALTGTLNVLLEEYIDQLLSSLSTLMNVL